MVLYIVYPKCFSLETIKRNVTIEGSEGERERKRKDTLVRFPSFPASVRILIGTQPEPKEVKAVLLARSNDL